MSSFTNANAGRRRFASQTRTKNDNDSILNAKPFLVLLGLLVLALVIQFSIVFAWFHRSHHHEYHQHQDVVGITRRRRRSEEKIIQYARVITPEVKNDAAARHHEEIITKVNNAAAAAADSAADSDEQQKSPSLRQGDIIPKIKIHNVKNVVSTHEHHSLLLEQEKDVSSKSDDHNNNTNSSSVRAPKLTSTEAAADRGALRPRRQNKNYLYYEVNDHTNATPEVLNAVIHIGPYKTVTTAIQQYSHKLVKELAQDGYEMPWSHLQMKIRDKHGLTTHLKGKTVPGWWCQQTVFATCFFQNVPTNRMMLESPAMCEPEILDAAAEIAQQNKNSLFVSAEQFSNTEIEGVEALEEFLSNRWNNVTIVATYRRYFEWIVSFYNERWKGVQLYDASHANKTDRLFPSLYHELHFNHNFNNEIQHKYTLAAVARFKKHFRNVVVMNYHDESNSLLNRFYCDVIPNAHNTCQKLKNTKMTKFNTSHNRIYEELAYAAHRRGMFNIKSKQKAKSAEVLIHQHQEKTLNLTIDDFPRKCLPKDILEDIWTTSLEAEKEFGGGEVDEYSMKDAFDKYRKTSFCEVDLDAILQSPHWVEFFADLIVEMESIPVRKKRIADVPRKLEGGAKAQSPRNMTKVNS